MRFKALTLAAAMCTVSVVLAAQGRGGAPLPPATDTVAPDIPGVVAGGTKVQLLKEGLDGTEGPIALPTAASSFPRSTQTD